MGIDIYVLDSLLKYRAAAGRLGHVLMVGRQGLHIDPELWQAQATEILRKYDPDVSFADIKDETGYSEKLFLYLGAESVQSIDYSPFEGAEIVHDLNVPVPKTLENRFDFIFDGGTLEHVFNVAVAFNNIKVMLRKNGVYMGYLPANDCLGHGFYQFSPELLWRVFSEESGFTVEKMLLQRLWNSGEDRFPPIEAKDPAKEGVRQELGGLGGTTMIIAAARKTGCASGTAVQQSDWTAAWDQFGARVAEQALASRSNQDDDIAAETLRTWFHDGKFEEMAHWLGAIAEPKDPGDRQYAFGRLAAAMLVADTISFDTAAEFAQRFINGPEAPAEVMPILARWSTRSPEASQAMRRLAAEAAVSREEMIATLRELAERDDFGTIRRLAQTWHERAPDEFTSALMEVARDQDTLRDFARVPRIGEVLAEMRLFRIKNTLSVLLGINPKGAVPDEMRYFSDLPRYIKLIPISESAEAEWAALNAADK